MDAATNLPIGKAAYIASSTSGKLKVYSSWKNRSGSIINISPDGPFFLVDGLITFGNSGGPVVAPYEYIYNVSPDGRVLHSKGKIPNLVLGIVSNGDASTGLTVIYASDIILEMLNERSKLIKAKIGG
ncbi:MAG TPA: hypothetical protein VNS32_03365 [Flavisolibacter sp.]|nr:hypothetical protein [Flavisolibacter sp.]